MEEMALCDYDGPGITNRCFADDESRWKVLLCKQHMSSMSAHKLCMYRLLCDVWMCKVKPSACSSASVGTLTA